MAIYYAFNLFYFTGHVFIHNLNMKGKYLTLKYCNNILNNVCYCLPIITINEAAYLSEEVHKQVEWYSDSKYPYCIVIY